MKILTFSSLYPNAVDPSHGIFVERRLTELVSRFDVQATVVAPVPWFPFKSRLFGKYGKLAQIPRKDHREGIDIYYPRYPLLPKIGMSSAPASMAKATENIVRKLAEEQGGLALIDAHYFYPDGVAVAKIADRLGIPFVISARGSDINTIATIPGPRKLILEAAQKARAVIAVSAALGQSLQDLGVEPSKIHVLPNGVDLKFFKPGNREASRRKLKFETPTFLSVGALKEAKGHDVAIRALHHIDNARLVIVGTGEYQRALKRVVETEQLGSRVTFAGRLNATELRDHYQAADALFLISRREGMPNVVLESMACGTPIVATNVGGISELVNSSSVGELVADRTPDSVAGAWRKLAERGIDRAAIRQAAESHSWQDTATSLAALLAHIGQNTGTGNSATGHTHVA